MPDLHKQFVGPTDITPTDEAAEKVRVELKRIVIHHSRMTRLPPGATYEPFINNGTPYFRLAYAGMSAVFTMDGEHKSGSPVLNEIARAIVEESYDGSGL